MNKKIDLSEEEDVTEPDDDCAWDSTCERCNFHYYNAEGDGPTLQSENHGSNGWKVIDELEDDLSQGSDFQFLIGAYIEMRHRGYELICGDCVDELCFDEEENDEFESHLLNFSR